MITAGIGVLSSVVMETLFPQPLGAERGIKAPRGDEPNLPPAADDAVLFVLFIQVIGCALDERCAHRIERLSAVTGADPGEPLEPEYPARLLASPEGALKGRVRLPSSR